MRRTIMALAALTVIGGCGNPSPTGGGGGAVTPLDVSGRWNIAYTFTYEGKTNNLDGNVQLIQNGSNVSGHIVRDDGGTGPSVSGAVNGQFLNLRVGPVSSSDGYMLSITSDTRMDSAVTTGSGPASIVIRQNDAEVRLDGTARITRR